MYECAVSLPRIMSKTFSEFEPWCQEATISAESPRLIRNVVLCGNKSRNGYEIPESAFSKGAQLLYEGKPVFIDHSENPINRKVRDLAGCVLNVRMENGRPRGDIECEETDAGDTLLKLARRPRKGLGMSHVAHYKFNKGRTQVESVEDVLSVDVVVNPATTNTFNEHANGGKNVDEAAVKALTDQIAQLKEENTKIKGELDVAKADVKTIGESAKAVESELAKVKTERDELKAKVDVADRKAAIESELSEAKVDTSNKAFCSEAFMKLLADTPTAESRKALISDRVTLLGESAKHVVIGQGAHSGASKTEETFESMIPRS